MDRGEGAEAASEGYHKIPSFTDVAPTVHDTPLHGMLSGAGGGRSKPGGGQANKPPIHPWPSRAIAHARPAGRVGSSN